MEKITQDTFHQLPKKELSDEQIKDILLLYSVNENTQQININEFTKPVFAWYQKPDLDSVAMKFNKQYWDYMAGTDRRFVNLA